MFHNVYRKGHRYCTAVVTRDMTSTEIPRKIYDELLADLMKGHLVSCVGKRPPIF